METKKRKAEYGAISVSEQNGIRYLHFGTQWIQGAMNLNDPNKLELAYSWQMMGWLLFKRNPRELCQLGLGSASLTKYCYWHFPKTKVTVVELNPEVIAVCRAMFCLPPDNERLKVFQMDAMDFVTDEKNAGRFDILSSDVYDAEANGPVLDSPEYYTACRNCLKEDGILAVNLFGDHPSYAKNIAVMEKVFGALVPLTPTPEGNAIVLAFKKRPEVNYEELKDRATLVKDLYGFAARKWAKDVKRAWLL